MRSAERGRASLQRHQPSRGFSRESRPAWRLVLAVLFAAACADPGDTLYTPPPLTPLDVGAGVFQLTVDPRPDYVRGFTATGDSVLFAALRPGENHDTTWAVFAAPATGGAEREVAALYHQALGVPAMSLISRANDRVLAVWKAGNDGVAIGPAGCPTCYRLAAWVLRFVHLNAVDGTALTSLPSWTVNTTSATILDPRFETFTARVRITPAEQEATNGTNPFGPVATVGGTSGYYSDGEVVWRIALDNAGQAADSVTEGAFPALSPDGTLLALSVPMGLDSTQSTCLFPHGLAVCTEIMVTFSYTGWTTRVIRVASGDTVLTTPGAEPVFAPDGTRMVIRGDSLSWVDLTSGAVTPIAGTAGAFSPAISPDGMYLAFSKVVGGNADVYFVKLK